MSFSGNGGMSPRSTSTFQGFDGSTVRSQSPQLASAVSPRQGSMASPRQGSMTSSYQYQPASPFGTQFSVSPRQLSHEDNMLKARVVDEVMADSDFEDQLYAVMLKLRDIRNRAIRTAIDTNSRLTGSEISAAVDLGLEGLGVPGFGDKVYQEFDIKEMSRQNMRATTGMMPGNPTLVQQYQNTPYIATQQRAYSPPQQYSSVQTYGGGTVF